MANRNKPAGQDARAPRTLSCSGKDLSSPPQDVVSLRATLGERWEKERKRTIDKTAFPMDYYTRYENGVKLLLERIGREHPRFREASILRARLKENISRAKHLGENHTVNTDRYDILYSLDDISLEILNISFDELCKEASRSAPPEKPKTSDDGGYYVIIEIAFIAIFIIALFNIPDTNSSFPVTIAEWRKELAERSKIFGQCNGYWCYVPAGTYYIGGWTNDNDDSNDVGTNVTLPGFWIAKYPLTVRQYREFINEGGYTNKDLWTPDGWAWRTDYNSGQERNNPYVWPGANDSDRFNVEDSHPVVTLSWYEVTAFAKWLNTELASSLPVGYRIRLPTEAEWEVACAYDGDGNRRIYLWGNRPEPGTNYADFGKDWNEGGTSPIGKRPYSAAACGAQDLVGSVWEPASSNWYGYPEQATLVVDDFAMGDKYVPWRGGSWGNPETHVNCAARYMYYPDSVVDASRGGRIVLSP